MVFVFDLDDCLCRLRESLHSAIKKTTGMDIHWTEWNSYDLSSVYGTSSDLLLQAFIKGEALENAEMEPDAKNIIGLAKEAGHRTVILTARAWHPKGSELTENLLKSSSVIPDELIVIPLGVSKADFLSKLGKVSAVLDDHADHLDAFKAAGVNRTFLMTRPWNERRHGHERVNSLKELAGKMEWEFLYEKKENQEGSK